MNTMIGKPIIVLCRNIQNKKHKRANMIMINNIKNTIDISNITSFFTKVSKTIVDVLLSIRHHYFPIEEHQINYVFNDTTRHCPKSHQDMIDVYTAMYEVFKDIEHTDLFRSMRAELDYAMMPNCKNWHDANVMSMPTVMESPFDNIITECADRMSTTYWVLWYNDKTEVVQPHQNRGTFRTRTEVLVINDKADDMPDNVIAAAQVTLGIVQTRDNILKGFQWKLYR